MKIVGVILQRNELDVILFNVLHHLGQVGLDEIIVGDNGSTDGSLEALKFLASEEPRLRVIPMPGLFSQAKLTNELVQIAAGNGADWVVPLDADEFLDLNRIKLEKVLNSSSDAAVEMKIFNYVQNRRVINRKMHGIFSMVFVAKRRGSRTKAMKLVSAGKIGFVEMVYPPKYMWRADPELKIEKGNHGGSVTLPKDLKTVRLNHVPMRNRDSIKTRTKRINRIEEGASPTNSWHLRRLADVDSAEEWERNSAKFGHLHVSGVRRRLEFDPFFVWVFFRHAFKVQRVVQNFRKDLRLRGMSNISGQIYD